MNREAPLDETPFSDADKLRVLALWFDMWDKPETDRQAILDDKRFPGKNDVQVDLRRIAGYLDQLRAERIDVAVLRALSEAATPGPWSFEGLTEDGWALMGNTPEPEDGGSGPEMPYGYPGAQGVAWTREDAAFIAAAVNYVRAALASQTREEGA